MSFPSTGIRFRPEARQAPRNRAWLAATLLGLAFVGWVGCGNPPSAPVDLPFLGQYRSTALRSVFFGDTIDHLATGARFDLELLATGEAIVDLVLPGGEADGSDLIENFTSTWSAVRIPAVFDTAYTTVRVRPVTGGRVTFVYRAIYRWQGDSLTTGFSLCGFTTLDYDVRECRIDISLER